MNILNFLNLKSQIKGNLNSKIIFDMLVSSLVSILKKILQKGPVKPSLGRLIAPLSRAQNSCS